MQVIVYMYFVPLYLVPQSTCLINTSGGIRLVP